MRLLPASIRRRARLPRLLPLLLLALGLVLISVPTAQGAGSGSHRAPDVPQLPRTCFAPGQDGLPPGLCHLTPYRENRPTVVIWGDSHAWMFIPALERAVRGKPVNLVSFVAGSCAPTLIPVPSDGRYATKCEENNVLAMQWLTEHQRAGDPLKLVLGSNWVGFRDAYQKLVRGEGQEYAPFTKRMIRLEHRYTAPLFARLARLGVPTDVISQSATVPDREDSDTGCTVGTPPYNPYVCDVARRRAIPHEALTRQWLRHLMQPLAGDQRLIDTTGYYCNAKVCHGRVDGVLTWYDHLHLSATRTRSMWRLFLPSVSDLLPPATPRATGELFSVR